MTFQIKLEALQRLRSLGAPDAETIPLLEKVTTDDIGAWLTVCRSVVKAAEARTISAAEDVVAGRIEAALAVEADRVAGAIAGLTEERDTLRAKLDQLTLKPGLGRNFMKGTPAAVQIVPGRAARLAEVIAAVKDEPYPPSGGEGFRSQRGKGIDAAPRWVIAEVIRMFCKAGGPDVARSGVMGDIQRRFGFGGPAQRLIWETFVVNLPRAEATENEAPPPAPARVAESSPRFGPSMPAEFIERV